MADKFPRPFGRYVLLAPLAQGGMGALYLSCVGDKGYERLCVIKTVLPHLADPEGERADDQLVIHQRRGHCGRQRGQRKQPGDKQQGTDGVFSEVIHGGDVQQGEPG